MSYFRDALGMDAGAAARAAAPVQPQPLPRQHAEASMPDAAAADSGSPATASEEEARVQKWRQVSGLLQECFGLPVPTARSTIVPLGAQR